MTCRYGAACEVHRPRRANEVGTAERAAMRQVVDAGWSYAAAGRDHGLTGNQVRKMMRRFRRA